MKTFLVTITLILSLAGCDGSGDCVQMWDDAKGNNTTPMTQKFAEKCCSAWRCQAKLFEESDKRRKDD